MDPTGELLVAVIARLKATSAVTVLVGQRIYDRVPTGEDAPSSPYISLGPHDDVSEDADCVEGYRITFQVDAWSWGAGEAYSRIEAGGIAKAVRDALRDWSPTLTTNAFVLIEHRTTRFLRDLSESAINHAAMTFEAFVEG